MVSFTLNPYVFPLKMRLILINAYCVANERNVIVGGIMNPFTPYKVAIEKGI